MSEVKQLLEAVRAGTVSVEEALHTLKKEPFADIGYAKVDLHRRVRQGAAEVIYGAGKTPAQIAGILDTMEQNGQGPVLITRLSPEAAEEVSRSHPLSYHADARVAIRGDLPEPSGLGTIVVATGGTSDIPVAEEAYWTARILGNDVLRLYDVGVAGLHRTLHHLDEILDASVIIAIAGVGYGASFHGLAALLSMLNSCASGVSVVNIDNGFGAGFLASRINHMEPRR